ncbi:hypothetical protein UCRPA7_8310 [Phaeoacremonium minimum UCRPA7]|uniref:Uncharacterized protein n=1 Tax=Phaeoacremonium minimum (strain UCR-PA7) TaxID=1286976 RepID=R8BAB5_PHAM7|nr:hypothetical protein UCRPA7_8310 [Phaeoacremonium minimum UCRPA7]EON96231.1 hypothetical protein UCRPA7_8310 [Phaeoacremonium minimum UCRPA7]
MASARREQSRGTNKRSSPVTVDGPVGAAFQPPSSFSACTFTIKLRAGVQPVSLYVHDDFAVSDSPVIVQLGHDTMRIVDSPPADGARILGLPDVLDEEEEEEGEEENTPVNGGGVRIGRNRQQSQGKRRRSCFSLPASFALVIILVIIFLVGPPRRQREPAPPDYAATAPLDPGPDVAFVDLMVRHAAVPRAIVESGATNKYNYMPLLSDATDYCHKLRLMLAGHWSATIHAPSKRNPDRQQWWVWMTGWARNGPEFGLAHDHAQKLCKQFTDPIFPLALDVVVPLHVTMRSFWGAHALSGLRSASSGLRRLFPQTHRQGILLLEGEAYQTTSSMGDQGFDSSFAVAVLKELTTPLTMPWHYTQEPRVNLRALNESLNQLVMLGEKLLAPEWEQWLALNRGGGDYVPDAEPSRKDLRALAKLRDQTLARLSVLKDVRERFLSPVSEALAVTESDVDQLKEFMKRLITGSGWIRPEGHGGQRVLTRYYFSPRPDLPTWIDSVAENLTIELTEFAYKLRQTDALREEQESLKREKLLRGPNFLVRLWTSIERWSRRPW